MSLGQKVASLFVDIGANISGLEKGLSTAKTGLVETAKTAKSSGMALTEFWSGLNLIKEAAGYVSTVLNATAGETLNYAMQVRELSKALGATPEEASKLIQVADDVGISVGSLTQGLQAAIRNGLSPTITGIGELSDQFLALPEGVERTRFLLEKFGRSGADLARLMELGSNGIDAMGKSIEGTALLMDSKGIQAAENYRKAIDEAGDAWLGFKIKIGNWGLPGLTAVLKLMTDISNIKSFGEGADASAAFINSFFGLKEASIDLSDSMFKLGESSPYAASGLDALSGSIAGATEQMDRYNKSTVGSGRESGLRTAKDDSLAASWAFKQLTDREREAKGEAEKLSDALKSITWDTADQDLPGTIIETIKGAQYKDVFGPLQAQYDVMLEYINANPMLSGDAVAAMLEPILLEAEKLAVKLGDESMYGAAVESADILKRSYGDVRGELESLFTVTKKGSDEKLFDNLFTSDMLSELESAGTNMGTLGQGISETGTAAGDAAGSTKKIGEGVEKMAEKGGDAVTQMGELGQKFLDMQPQLETDLDLLAGINKQIALLHSKSITIKIHTIYSSSGSGGGGGANTPRSGSGDRAGTPGNSGGRAAGGPMFPGLEYRVNERGQEWLKIPFAGSMTPAHQAPTGGGDTYIVNQYISDQGTAALAAAEIRRLRDASINSHMGR